MRYVLLSTTLFAFLICAVAKSGAGASSDGNLVGQAPQDRVLEAVTQQAQSDRHDLPPSHGPGLSDISLAENDLSASSILRRRPSLDHGLDHPYTHYNLGLFYCKNERNVEAIDSLSNSIDLAPRFSSAYHLRGLMYFERRDFPNALSDFEVVLGVDPKNGNAEVYRDRSSLCIQERYHCDFMEGNRCQWTMYFQRSAIMKGPPGYLPKSGLYLPPLD